MKLNEMQLTRRNVLIKKQHKSHGTISKFQENTDKTIDKR